MFIHCSLIFAWFVFDFTISDSQSIRFLSLRKLSLPAPHRFLTVGAVPLCVKGAKGISNFAQTSLHNIPPNVGRSFSRSVLAPNPPVAWLGNNTPVPSLFLSSFMPSLPFFPLSPTPTRPRGFPVDVTRPWGDPRLDRSCRSPTMPSHLLFSHLHGLGHSDSALQTHPIIPHLLIDRFVLSSILRACPSKLTSVGFAWHLIPTSAIPSFCNALSGPSQHLILNNSFACFRETWISKANPGSPAPLAASSISLTGEAPQN